MGGGEGIKIGEPLESKKEHARDQHYAKTFSTEVDHAGTVASAMERGSKVSRRPASRSRTERCAGMAGGRSLLATRRDVESPGGCPGDSTQALGLSNERPFERFRGTGVRGRGRGGFL
jgi:hypothetical protein